MEKIAIIGASEFQVPLINKAKAMGLETHVFAWQTGDPGEYCADHFYPINITSKQAILDECKKLAPCAVISCASSVAIPTVAFVAGALGLNTISPTAVTQTTNKLAMRKALSEADIPQPKFAEVGDSIPLTRIQTFSYPLVVKPSDRSGGRGVKCADNERAMLRAVSQARETSYEHRAIVEEYIAGDRISVETLSFEGQHKILAYTADDVIERDGSFLEIGHHQPAPLSSGTKDRIEELTYRVLDAVGIHMGAAHVKMIIDPQDRLWVLEVSASMNGDFIGSDLVPLSTGYDYLKMVIQVARRIAPDFTPAGEPKDASIHYLLCGDHLAALNALRDQHPGQIVRLSVPETALPAQPGERRYGYYITARRPKEMGGYLPLELSTGKEYFKRLLPTQYVRLNSGRTAIWCAVRELKAKRVFIPHFCNPAVAEAVRDAGAEVEFYHLNEQLLPRDLQRNPEDVLLLVNYYGAMDQLLSDYVQDNRNIIIDNAAAFFCAPILREDVYNVYSCRKFIGVADGAYLVGKQFNLNLPEIADTDLSATYLLAALQKGTNSAYALRQACEKHLSQQRSAMSDMTQKILDSVDYDEIIRKRRSNYACLDRLLGRYNQCHFPLEENVPQYYPFLAAAGVREKLIAQRIYLPMLWRKCLTMEGTVEQTYAQQMCCLPIDQRYDEADMQYLADLVIRAVGPDRGQ